MVLPLAGSRRMLRCLTLFCDGPPASSTGSTYRPPSSEPRHHPPSSFHKPTLLIGWLPSPNHPLCLHLLWIFLPLSGRRRIFHLVGLFTLHVSHPSGLLRPPTPTPRRFFPGGMEALLIHSGNYNAVGPTPCRLQLLWWELPPEKWDDLREGSCMNFLTPHSTFR